MRGRVDGSCAGFRLGLVCLEPNCHDMRYFALGACSPRRFHPFFVHGERVLSRTREGEKEGSVMSKSHASTSSLWRLLRLLLLPLILVGKLLDKHFVSFIRGRVLRGEDRVFSLRFVWYSDSVYLHPMIWGSLVLYLFASQVVVTDAKPLTEA